MRTLTIKRFCHVAVVAEHLKPLRESGIYKPAIKGSRAYAIFQFSPMGIAAPIDVVDGKKLDNGFAATCAKWIVRPTVMSQYSKSQFSVAALRNSEFYGLVLGLPAFCRRQFVGPICRFKTAKPSLASTTQSSRATYAFVTTRP